VSGFQSLPVTVLRSVLLRGAAASSLVTGSLPLFLCLTLTGCWSEGVIDNPLIGENMIVPEWIGEYDGAATAHVYTTDNVYSDVPAYVAVERVSQTELRVSVSIAVSPGPADLEDIADFTGGPIGPDGLGWAVTTPMADLILKTTVSLAYQSGIRRNRLSLTKTKERVVGLLYVDVQRSEGVYDVVCEIEIDVLKRSQ
jgi:hypothetical protein